MQRKKVSILLPARDEQDSIGKVIDEIPKRELEERGYQIEILVIDNDSTDRTAEIAAKKGARVIIEPARGKGRAVRTGFQAVHGDFIFMLDADNTYPADRIPDMVRLLGQSDVVMGSRLRGRREKGAMSLLNLIGNFLLSLLGTALYQKRTSDVCTGYWGFKGDVVRSLNLRATGFELEAELFSQLCKKGYSIAELPIYYRRRATAPKLSSLRDGFKIGRTLIRERFR